MKDHLIPPRGIGYILSCPHECVNVYFPGEDPDRFITWSPNRTDRRTMGIGECPLNDTLHYITQAWSNL